MSGRWAPAWTFFGLHVDCGHYSTHRDKWLRLPTARLTCRWGCQLDAVGVADVIDLTSTAVPDHARTCPGPGSGARTAPSTHIDTRGTT